MPPSHTRVSALSRLQELIGTLPSELRMMFSMQLTHLVQSQQLTVAQETLLQEIEVWTLSYLPDLQRLEETPTASAIEQLREAERQLEAGYGNVAAAANSNDGTTEEQLDRLRQQVFSLYTARHQYGMASEAVCNAEVDYATYVLRSSGALEQLAKIFKRYQEACS